MLEWYYKNIVIIVLCFNVLDWVYYFIEDYCELLFEGVWDNVYWFNLAFYYYVVKEYDKVFVLFIWVEYSDLRYSFGVKVLLLWIYYDFEEYSVLYVFVDFFW